MQWYALIQAGVFAGVSTSPTDFPLPPGLVVNDVVTPSEIDAVTAFLASGGKLSPPAFNRASAQATARAAIIAALDVAGERVTSRYPAAEVASWPLQVAEARAVNGGATAATAPLLATLAKAFGVTLADMAGAVIEKAAAYQAVVAAIIIARDAGLGAVDAAETAEEIAAAVAAAQAAAGRIAV